MANNLNIIDQSGLRAVLRERIAKREAKPLVVWRADFGDGIEERIVREVLNEYNNGLEQADRLWFREVGIREYPAGRSNAVNELICGSEVESDDGSKHVGLMVIDPSNALAWPPLYDVLKSLINDRVWNGVKAAAEVPMVCFMPVKEAQPGDFADAEQYVFAPEFDEWATWAKAQQAISDSFVDFVKGDGSNVAYRWYNKFAGDGGCQYPSCWLSALARMRMSAKLSRIKSIADLSADSIRACFSGISDDLIDEFITFLKNNPKL